MADRFDFAVAVKTVTAVFASDLRFIPCGKLAADIGRHKRFAATETHANPEIKVAAIVRQFEIARRMVVPLVHGIMLLNPKDTVQWNFLFGIQ